jgi:starvation-inducible DNA-binding protein
MATKMFKTKNPSSEEVREQVVDMLNARLADSIDLHYQAKQAHWNVKGDDFFQLHELFDKVAEATEGHIDLIAERITQLGGTANGTVRDASKNSTLTEYPHDIYDGDSHVEALSNALATFASNIKQNVDDADQLNDMGTNDMLVEIMREIDKYLWFVEAHNQVEGKGKSIKIKAAN